MTLDLRYTTQSLTHWGTLFLRYICCHFWACTLALDPVWGPNKIYFSKKRTTILKILLFYNHHVINLEVFCSQLYKEKIMSIDFAQRYTREFWYLCLTVINNILSVSLFVSFFTFSMEDPYWSHFNGSTNPNLTSSLFSGSVSFRAVHLLVVLTFATVLWMPRPSRRRQQANRWLPSIAKLRHCRHWYHFKHSWW